jgi:hypothetical protein
MVGGIDMAAKLKVLTEEHNQNLNRMIEVYRQLSEKDPSNPLLTYFTKLDKTGIDFSQKFFDDYSVKGDDAHLILALLDMGNWPAGLNRFSSDLEEEVKKH